MDATLTPIVENDEEISVETRVKEIRSFFIDISEELKNSKEDYNKYLDTAKKFYQFISVLSDDDINIIVTEEKKIEEELDSNYYSENTLTKYKTKKRGLMIIINDISKEILNKLLELARNKVDDSNSFIRVGSLIGHEFAHIFSTDLGINMTILSFSMGDVSVMGYSSNSVRRYAENAIKTIDILSRLLESSNALITLSKIADTVNMDIVAPESRLIFDNPEFKINLLEFLIIRTLIHNAIKAASEKNAKENTQNVGVTIEIEIEEDKDNKVEFIRVIDNISSEWDEKSEMNISSGKNDYMNSSEDSSYETISGGLRMVAYLAKGEAKLIPNSPVEGKKTVEVKLPLKELTTLNQDATN